MSPIYELFLSTFPIVPEVFLLATFDPKFAKDFPVGGRKKRMVLIQTVRLIAVLHSGISFKSYIFYILSSISFEYHISYIYSSVSFKEMLYSSLQT